MIKKILYSFVFFSTLVASAQVNTVECDTPLNETYCYDNNDNTVFEFVSEDGSSLNLTFNSGNVEAGWDVITVLDTDGTVLFTGDGDISGLSFQSTGDTISFEMDTDGSISCVTGQQPEIDYTVVCATCTNPTASFELVNDCLNAPQFFIDVDVTDLGSATSLEITDSEGISTETVTQIGVTQIGPFPNGTNVSVDVQSLDDANCSVSSGTFAQEFCTLTEIDCSQPFNGTYCYDDNDDTTLEFVSEDGSPLNLDFNSGNIELNFDDLIVFDTDGTVLFDLNTDEGGFGNFDVSGLTFQSTGDTISFQITSDGSVSCASSAAYNELDYTVTCATCTNPSASFELVSDCLNAPQFFIDVDVTDLGSATSLEITDSEGVSTETVTELGVVQVGPFPNGTNVSVDVQSLDDANCNITSQDFTQDFCALTEIDCSQPFNGTYCYDNNDDTTLEFVSEDGSPLNLVFNSGNIELNFDDLIVFDTDGTVLFDLNADEGGFGNFDVSGLTFQSTGDTISFQITSDGSISCASSAAYNELDYTLTCATCTNPNVDFSLVNDCLNAPQFFIDVDVIDLGTATTLEITDSEGISIETITETGIVQVGPFPNGTDVTVDVVSLDDANCSVTSSTFSQEFCTLTEVACNEPLNDTFCYGNNEDVTIEYVSEDGTPLNLNFNSGNIELNFDNLIVFDSDGSVLFDLNASQGGFGNFDVSGLSFQSTGDSISFQITSDGSISCESSATYDELDYTVACATCINPQATFTVIGNCVDEDTPDFLVEVNIESLGDATSLLVTNNQGDAPQVVTETGELVYGPYPLGTPVEFTIANQDDANCTISSNTQTLGSCDCFGAEPFCAPEDNSPLVFENISDGTIAPPDIDYGCLGSQPNPVWFYLIVEESGDLEFEIVQSTQLDDNGFPDQNTGLIDVDFLAWGPFESPVDGCSNLVPDTQVDCSFSAAPIEEFIIPNAQAGEVYIVLITNFDGADGFISLGQTNLQEPGSGSTDCEFIFTEYGCASDGVLLSSDIEDGAAYQWFILDDPDADPDDTSNYVPVEGGENQEFLATQTGNYFVISQAQDNSFSEEFFTVRLSEEPELDMGLEHNLCEGDTLDLDATPVNSSDYSSITYQWFDEDGPIEGATSPEFTFSETGIHTLEITTEELLGSTTFECVNLFEINIQGANFEVDLGDDQSFCDAEGAESIMVSLEGDIEDDAVITYLWSTGEETESISVAESGTYAVEVSVDGCVETAEVTYTFNESPQINLPTSVESCNLLEVVLDATPQNADASMTTFEWRLDGVLLEDEFMELISADDYGFGTYELTAYTDDEDCAFVQEIEIAPRFVSASLATDSFDDLFCPGEEVVIAADVSGIEGDDVTYTWFVNGIAQAAPNQAEFVYEVGSDTANPNQDVIALSVNVGGDCVANTVEIDLDRYSIDNCIIPEGMSPDGINHTLDLRFLADRSGIRSLEIFNRFGKSVFKQNNYTNEFTGQNQNGTRLVTGTYFYVIKFNQEDPVYGREHKGWIYLNREQQ